MKTIDLNIKTQEVFRDGISKIDMLKSQIHNIESILSRDIMLIAESQIEINDGDSVSLSMDGKRIEIKSKEEVLQSKK
jgi:hypothetical protein